jgi:hypothetical protein
LYEDAFHNVTEELEGIAFMIATEEVKEQLLRAEKLGQADLRRELDIKCGKVLGNEDTSGADKEFIAARITVQRREEKGRRKSCDSAKKLTDCRTSRINQVSVIPSPVEIPGRPSQISASVIRKTEDS